MKNSCKYYSEKQTIEGFGSSSAWWSQIVGGSDNADEVASLLYSSDGLAMNIYRYNIGGGSVDIKDKDTYGEIDRLIQNIPYFKENLPEYEKGRIQNNLWVDLAMQDNYQLSFNDFLYGKNLAIQQVKCHENSHSLVDFFYSRFGIRH